jgi:hypothetical protein
VVRCSPVAEVTDSGTPFLFTLPHPPGVLGGAARRTAAALQAHRAVQEVQRRAAQAAGAGVPHVPDPRAGKGQPEVLTWTYMACNWWT